MLPLNILRLREALSAGDQPVVDGERCGLDHAIAAALQSWRNR